ncbi:hypothetical protein Purlil1_12688 [Purpureocillium lilacinum]|uniref:Uncharacterized protein n=1 Tax=Purpureocillium lilacinum TaxID=33203 RepID=A0ABR0BG74_PURLI|nr:hypothetical protein Purlil1_12688 [Purpureocillium lilacinum]
MSVAANDERALGQPPEWLQDCGNPRWGGRLWPSLITPKKRQGWLQTIVHSIAVASTSRNTPNAARTVRSKWADWRHPELAASHSRTQPELDEAVGLPGGIPHKLAASRINWRHPAAERRQNWTEQSGWPQVDWRHPRWTGGIAHELAASRMNWRHPAAKRGQNWTKQWGDCGIPQQHAGRTGRSSRSVSILCRDGSFWKGSLMGAVVAACYGANWPCGRGQYDPATAAATANCANGSTCCQQFGSAIYVRAVIKPAICMSRIARTMPSDGGSTSLICNVRKWTKRQSEDAGNLETPPAGSPQFIPDAFLCGVPPSCTNGSLGGLRRAQFGYPSASMVVGNRPVGWKLRITDLHTKKWTLSHITQDAANGGMPLPSPKSMCEADETMQRESPRNDVNKRTSGGD